MLKHLLLYFYLMSISVVHAQSGKRWYYNIDENNLAIGGYDLIAYHSGTTAVKGSKKFAIEFQGVEYWFESKTNMRSFKLDPSRYLPAYGGWCTFFMGIDQSKTNFPPTRMQSDPENFKIINGKLHLFRKTERQNFKTTFESGDSTAILQRANEFWDSRIAYGERSAGIPEGLNPMARMENLDWLPFMGKWETQVTWWADTTGTNTSSFNGEWEFRYGYYGFCVADDFRGVPDLPFAGTQNGPAVRGYDVANKEWHMTYIPINQPRSATWLMTGKFKDYGHLEGFLETKDPYGNNILQKVIFRLIDRDSFEWEAQWSWDNGKTWKEKTGFAVVNRIK